ncbi:DUF1638 domain-containing protein [Terrisporobacter sp.]
MKIFILSCGVFEPELNIILKEIKDEKIFNQDIEVKYLPFGLHTNLDKLKYEITNNLDNIQSDKVILLYGSKCHYMFYEFLKNYPNLITFEDSNCIDLIIGNKKNNDEKDIYITPGWILKFDELNKFMKAVDMYDIRQQYGRYDNVIIGDTKSCKLTDEMIFDLFEKIQVPIEIQNIDINNFKNKIINSINKAINS